LPPLVALRPLVLPLLRDEPRPEDEEERRADDAEEDDDALFRLPPLDERVDAPPVFEPLVLLRFEPEPEPDLDDEPRLDALAPDDLVRLDPLRPPVLLPERPLCAPPPLPDPDPLEDLERDREAWPDEASSGSAPCCFSSSPPRSFFATPTAAGTAMPSAAPATTFCFVEKPWPSPSASPPPRSSSWPLMSSALR
jgi:hypothetical protein